MNRILPCFARFAFSKGQKIPTRSLTPTRQQTLDDGLRLGLSTHDQLELLRCLSHRGLSKFGKAPWPFQWRASQCHVDAGNPTKFRFTSEKGHQNRVQDTPEFVLSFKQYKFCRVVSWTRVQDTTRPADSITESVTREWDWIVASQHQERIHPRRASLE
jgi:hypothetical protein